MTPSNPASDRNEAVEQANLAYPTETRHAAQRRAAFVVGWEASRAALATERASGGLDVERLAEWFHDKRESQGIACYHRNQHLTAWDCGQDAIEAAEYARLTPQPGEPSHE